MTPTRASTGAITSGRVANRSMPSSNQTSSLERAANLVSRHTRFTALPLISTAVGSMSPRRHRLPEGGRSTALRLDQAPAGVVALGVAGVGVAVEEIERQTLVGHLQRAVRACDGSQLTADAGTSGGRRSAGDADGRPDRGAPAGALAHAGRVTVE